MNRDKRRYKIQAGNEIRNTGTYAWKVIDSKRDEIVGYHHTKQAALAWALELNAKVKSK